MQSTPEKINADLMRIFSLVPPSGQKWETPYTGMGDAMRDGVKQAPFEHKVTIPEESEEIEPHYEMSFTRDKGLIRQYKKLRRDLYDIDPRFVGFREFSDPAAEDYDDPDDQMIIMHNGNKVYGGACLRISTPKHHVILNSEQDVQPAPGKFYFSLREFAPELGLDKYAYCELIRIVVHPSLRKGIVVRKLYTAALQRCLEHRVRYMFGVADKVRARFYRQVYSGFNVEKKAVTEMDIPMRPEYEGIEMLLICADMKNLYISPNDKDALCLLTPAEEFEFTE